MLVYVTWTYVLQSYRAISFDRSHDGPIEDIAFEQTHRRLAIVAKGSMRVWSINDDCVLPH
jgi:hypothetical protein